VSSNKLNNLRFVIKVLCLKCSLMVFNVGFFTFDIIIGFMWNNFLWISSESYLLHSESFSLKVNKVWLELDSVLCRKIVNFDVFCQFLQVLRVVRTYYYENVQLWMMMSFTSRWPP
jgi:hypothetical protein